MAQAMKDEIKLVINSILTAHPKGLTVDRLLKEYTRIECSHVPYRAMGYNSPQHMLSEMPDVVKFIRLSSGHSVVQAIPDEQSSHIYEMVAKQKNSGNRVMHNIKSLMYGSGHRPLINRSQNYYQVIKTFQLNVICVCMSLTKFSGNIISVPMECASI